MFLEREFAPVAEVADPAATRAIATGVIGCGECIGVPHGFGVGETGCFFNHFCCHTSILPAFADRRANRSDRSTICSMTWQRLSQRSVGNELDGPYEGVPEHLLHSIVYWFQGIAGYRDSNGMADSRLREVSVRLRVGLPVGWRANEIMAGLVNAACDDEEFCLDLIDASLSVWGRYSNQSATLKNLLLGGGSVWTVADDYISLTRVVSDEVQSAFATASSVEDEASNELRQAWANAYGRNGDPSDAWDHAIKAVEDVLIAVVVPNNGKATLAHVIGELNGANSAQWQMVLPGADKSNDVAPLVSMLRLMWPNHDRHGGVAPKRTPSVQEAQAVVSLAAVIVQWHRLGWAVQKR